MPDIAEVLTLTSKEIGVRPNKTFNDGYKKDYLAQCVQGYLNSHPQVGYKKVGGRYYITYNFQKELVAIVIDSLFDPKYSKEDSFLIWKERAHKSIDDRYAAIIGKNNQNDSTQKAA